MNEKIFETEIAVGPDHKVILELPETAADKKVKIVVTDAAPAESKKPFERSLGLALGQAKMLPGFFEPMSEDDLRLWEGRGDS